MMNQPFPLSPGKTTNHGAPSASKASHEAPSAGKVSHESSTTGKATGYGAPSAGKATGHGAPSAGKGGHEFPLPPEQVEAFGAEIAALHDRVRGELGERDARYIRRTVRLQRRAEVAGRALLFAGIFPPAWVAGTALLSFSKIVENMEIGHNVLHGQYDWMNDPALSSATYEWDNVCPADQWRHSHNYLHHTFTNVRGLDHDLGYRLLRVTEEQPWEPRFLPQLAYMATLGTLFQWGVGAHDVDMEAYLRTPAAERDPEETSKVRGMLRKAKRQLLKDYVLFPLLAGPFALPVFLGNLVANLARNVWSFAVIFCGHFPEGTATFSPESLDRETRAGWYLRQLLGSANFEGSRGLHFMSGHLSHQIEHHMFPDIPAHRYPEMSREVRAICEKYGLPYNSGSLGRQFLSVVKRVARLSLPSRKSPRAVSDTLPAALPEAGLRPAAHVPGAPALRSFLALESGTRTLPG
jgi:fatty acid desaturase